MSQTHVVAILLKDAERSRSFAEVLATQSVEAAVQETADALHQFINRERVDAVVIDNDLGGFLTGLEILERLDKDLLRPQTVLIGALSADEKGRAGRVGVDHVARPNASPKEISDAVDARLAVAGQALIPLPIDARRLVDRVDFIGPMPQLLAKLGSYLDSDTASLRDLARDISIDSRTTAELLKLTNSSSSGLSRKVNSLAEAVSMLGIRRTVALILASGVVATQKSLLNGLSKEMATWYHRRSVLIASVASSFAESLEGISPDTAHVVGLLQDVGILVLAKEHGERYRLLLDRVRAIGQLQLPVCERLQFNCTHAEVAAALLQKWGLPSTFVHMVLGHHHSEGLGDRPEVERRFWRVMQIGEALANCVDSLTIQRQHALNRLLAHYGPAQATACKESLQEGVAKSAELCALFSLPAPDLDELAVMLSDVQERLQEIGSEPEPEMETEMEAAAAP